LRDKDRQISSLNTQLGNTNSENLRLRNQLFDMTQEFNQVQREIGQLRSDNQQLRVALVVAAERLKKLESEDSAMNFFKGILTPLLLKYLCAQLRLHC
jgi:septal ring factor EnvC (AmiA/AmiB activator)